MRYVPVYPPVRLRSTGWVTPGENGVSNCPAAGAVRLYCRQLGGAWNMRRLRAGVEAAVTFDAATMGAGHGRMALLAWQS